MNVLVACEESQEVCKAFRHCRGYGRSMGLRRMTNGFVEI